jgi:hypothetical protein
VAREPADWRSLKTDLPALEMALVLARGIAEELGESFISYLIDMALAEAKGSPSGNESRLSKR